MKLWMTMDGGYLGLSSFEDAIAYQSIDDAKTSFWLSSRSHISGYPDTACVWFFEPNVASDPYPDEQWTIGPRGGIQRQKVM